jgi:hypothetical protein
MPSTSAHVARQFCPSFPPLLRTTSHCIGHRSASADCTCFVVAGWRIPVGSPPFDSKPHERQQATLARNPQQPAPTQPNNPRPSRTLRAASRTPYYPTRPPQHPNGNPSQLQATVVDMLDTSYHHGRQQNATRRLYVASASSWHLLHHLTLRSPLTR